MRVPVRVMLYVGPLLGVNLMVAVLVPLLAGANSISAVQVLPVVIPVAQPLDVTLKLVEPLA